MIVEIFSKYAVGELPGIVTKSIVDDRWGVEGLYSQKFSVGIFFFLMVCILVFTVIVVKFMNSGTTLKSPAANFKALKKGEKVLFIWIFFGIVVGVMMGISQLLQGYLF